MTGKDPKDMTASELLRSGNSNCGLCIMLTDGDCANHGCEKIYSVLADKIDAELAEARKDAIRESKKPMWWFRAAISHGEDWAEPRKGESFRHYLNRCFLPRPRFEDGEPVQFGEEVELHYKSGGCDKGRFQEIKYNKGSVWILSFTGVDHAREYRYDSERDTIKRPAPEVLGADGKPIVVGDTVYGVNNGHRYTVMGLPVPGNETVYNSNDDRLHLIHDESGLDAIFSAQKLTHTPPDTLERLRDDIAEWRADCANPGSGWDAKTAEWADRIDAIIRRTGGAE